MVRVITSTSAAARLGAARAFLAGRPPASELVIVGASRGAADDFARAIAHRAGATFGLTRFSLTELAARAAASRVEGARRAPGTEAGIEAVAARAVFEALGAGELAYFAPVATLPGFPKALARTLHELRLAGVVVDRVAGPNGPALHPDGRAHPGGRVHPDNGRPGPFGPGGSEGGPGSAVADIARLLARVETQLEAAAVDDRAALFRLAAQAWLRDAVRWAGLPLLLLDVPLDSRAEQEFVGALVVRAPQVMATVPDGDTFALAALTSLGAIVEQREDEAAPQSDLVNLRRFVFRTEPPPERDRAGDVTLFSAPGEGREAVEIVRRMLDEAARGVPFDEMAVLLRTPAPYLGLLEHACARGDVPVYFDRGTRRPDPSGRAFLALVSCAVDGLSAKRFDEYLSLGQVPQVRHPPGVGAERARPTAARGGPSADTASGARAAPPPDGAGAPADPVDSDDEAVVDGTLRAPWKWEELIVESAVVGGNARWRRRLDGLAADFTYRIEALRKEEPESPRIARFERDLRNLGHLREFALPIIDELAEWPAQAAWGAWLDRFTALAARALRRPARVVETLGDLRPMAEVGPVTLEEARDVLHDRLATLDWDPPDRRYGRAFVGTPHQARGRTFRVVFVPGLAERIVPQRPREDPLLLDEQRRALAAALVGQDERGAAERLLLKIAIGTATERVYLSYPRLDVAEARARVPSFYALDVVRAITGRVPDHRALAAEAAEAGGASLAWPAPRDPERAIDDLEHDLATLRPLLDAPDRRAVRGHAHYLLELNGALRRSVISRWMRDKSAWSPSDGLVGVAPGTQAALDANRLHRRPYSLSALQRFSTCPYQFLLATIHRLEPWDEPKPLVRMDPLTRGSLFHKAQAEFYRAMDAAGALPVTPEHLPAAVATLDAVLDRAAEEYAETLAPAIDRVWRAEIGEIRRDLGIWVRKLADPGPWRPRYFEFSFGLGAGSPREAGQSTPATRGDDGRRSATAPSSGGGGGIARAFDPAEGRDPRSLPEPVVVGARFILRGSVDLVEHDPARDLLRVTDHKTGKNRSKPDLVVDGGKVLQPVLYSMAVERALGKRVESARLYFATTAGGFAECPVPINDDTRSQALAVLTIIDRAIEQGFLPAAPDERACTWCDFRPVCGPREEERVARKARDKLSDLTSLRSMR